ncbi:hypothetical protein PEBR_42372 [Penicillium brasilianum]|uniref:Uncharacterized protein n=1 Tax=Penicillium brasilianum TaxID=104259 RepID=A0A1S9R953_PENBI|nr:hypothetical protein PEBR_42372 [Penicillium brasilianum]
MDEAREARGSGHAGRTRHQNRPSASLAGESRQKPNALFQILPLDTLLSPPIPCKKPGRLADADGVVALSHRSAYGVNGGASGPGYRHTGHDEVLECAVLFSIPYLLGQNHLIFLQSMRSSNIEPVNWAAAKNQTCQPPPDTVMSEVQSTEYECDLSRETCPVAVSAM